MVTTCLVALPGCSLTPLETETAQEFAREKYIPRIVSISVTFDGDESECFGSEDEWNEDLTQAFQDLNVAAAVWSTGEEEETGEEADLAVTLTVSRGTRSSEEVDRDLAGQGAFLNFLAWSVPVPILPMCLEDVQVVPDLSARVKLSVRAGDAQSGADEVDLLAENENIAIMTSFLERYEFFSWATLGALFVPPFVFREGNPEHLANSIASRVRAEVAWELAKLIKEWDLEDKELLKDLAVRKGAEGRHFLHI